MRIVIHQVADEETTLLPMAERLLGVDKLSELDAQMTRRRVELIKPHVGGLVVTTARSFPVGAAAGAALPPPELSHSAWRWDRDAGRA